MSEVKINSIVKLNTIFLLSQGSKHGYEIIKNLEDSLKRKISASNIYPFLKELEGKKYIECKSVEERDKKSYNLTPEGEQFAKEIMQKISGVMNQMLELKISTCYGCGSKVYEGGHQETIDSIERTFCCQHCAKASNI